MKIDTASSRAKISGLWWGALFLVTIVLGFLFVEGLDRILSAWEREEYSHGYLIPFISAYLIWEKRDVLAIESFTGSWIGFLVAAFGLVLYPMGELSTLYVLLQYGLVISFTGIAYAYLGWRAFRHVWVAFLLLFFTIPLPNFVYLSLSSHLQLISSELGVWFIRLFDISVFLEGNVIDLGSMKLQVVEACSGLRYLFPLATLAFIVAVFFRGSWWVKVVIFLSSLPITVLMNSFRIGAIGVLVEYWGKGMAEGFLHDFEGWVVFMAAFGVLLGEVWVFSRLMPNKVTSKESSSFRAEQPKVNGLAWQRMPFIMSACLLGGMFVLSLYLPSREIIVPDREEFVTFPTEIADWSGKKELMEPLYVDVLQFDDYLLTNYAKAGETPINLYAAYYDSQTKDVASHSPRACLPGDGWQIESFSQELFDDVNISNESLGFNRVLISRGDQRTLVYYWFQQRGRIITNEYLVKWFLFWDSLWKNRSDGALVRVTTPVLGTVGVAEADLKLRGFIKTVAPELPKYIPN